MRTTIIDTLRLLRSLRMSGVFRLLCPLRAVVLGMLVATFAHAQTLEEPRISVRAFEIEGDLPIPNDEAQRVLAPFVRDDADLSHIRNAAKALEGALAARGYSFYRVILPAQTLESTVKLRLLPFKLGNIEVSGNQHFSKENVLASLPALKKGDSPNVAAVARARALANEHPSKEVEVNFVQSELPDAVDAQVKVQDEPPTRFFVGLNNIGDRRTGQYRASIGLQHSNLWSRDHSVTASYTTSPGHVGDVGQYGLYYRIPFYSAGGALTLFYAYSDVNSGTIASLFEVSGRGKFAGLRYRQHLVPVGAYAHSLEFGLDDRYFDNNVLFSSTTQLGVDVRSRPLTFAYQGRFERAASSMGGRIEYARNLAGGKDNNDAAYAGNRAGASPDWQALRFGFDAQWRSAPLIFAARLRGQLSGEPLIAGEQFGLGGAASVRGLREREATGDTGFTVSVEGQMPLPWEGFYGVLFADAGEVRSKNTPAGQPARQGAFSIGLGIRWIIARQFSLAVDAAQVVDGTTSSESGDRRVHASMIYFF